MNETKTIEDIPAELVGENAIYQEFKKPEVPAYPDGYEARYFDNYLYKLNLAYSVDDILGDHAKSIAKGEGVDRFVMDSPMQKSEGERVLGYSLIHSAQAGEWQPKIIDVPKLTDVNMTSKEYMQRVEEISSTYDRGMIDGGVIFGIATAKRGGFVHTTEHENKVIVVPSQRAIEYFAKQK